MTKELIKNVVCPFCGSNCDDIEVEVENNKILNVYNACSVGTANFIPVPGAKRFTSPLWRESKTDEFKEIPWEEALIKAADIMVGKSRPLWFGWSETSVDAIREGVKLAEMTNGIIDGQVTHCHGPSVQAIQMVGYPSCTLGEIKNRADVVVYWGCNPLNAHPRHMSRYSSFTRGFFREDGRVDRTIIVVDPRFSDSAKVADFYYKINLSEDYEVFQALRAIINGNKLDQKEIGGIKRKELEKLAEKMKNAKFGVVFFGLGLTHSLGKSQNISAAIEMVQLLNSMSKWSIMPLRGHYNVTGLNMVLSWVTGYPYAVDFSRGFPRYNVGEYSTVEMLQRGQIDAMFSIAADPGAHLPQKCVEHMAKIPLIACDIHPTPTTELANLILPGTHDGIEAEASSYRMDAVPIHMKKVIDPPKGCMPSNAYWLDKLVKIIEDRVKE